MYWVNTMVYTKTELYQTNTKSQGLVSAYFALIISIVVHVVKHQSVLINTCMFDCYVVRIVVYCTATC